MLFLGLTRALECAKLGSNWNHLSLAKQISLLDLLFGCINLTLTSLCSANMCNTVPTNQSLSYMVYHSVYHVVQIGVGIVLDVSVEHNKVRVKFMHPKDPAKNLVWPAADNFSWIPCLASSETHISSRNNIDRELLQKIWIRPSGHQLLKASQMNQSIEGTVNHFFPIMSFRIIFRHWKNSVPIDASLDLVRYEDTPRFEQI